MQKKIRDAQRTKVYRWERALRNHYDVRSTMTTKECQDFIELMHKSYYKNSSSHPVPWVGDGRGCRSASYSYEKNKITLPRWARSKIVCAHEYAHYLTYTPNFTEPHGAFFVNCFMHLIERFCKSEVKMSVEGMKAMATEMGVKC